MAGTGWLSEPSSPKTKKPMKGKVVLFYESIFKVMSIMLLVLPPPLLSHIIFVSSPKWQTVSLRAASYNHALVLYMIDIELHRRISVGYILHNKSGCTYALFMVMQNPAQRTVEV